MSTISRESRIDIVRGLITDYASKVMNTNDLHVETLQIILREIADRLPVIKTP